MDSATPADRLRNALKSLVLGPSNRWQDIVHRNCRASGAWCLVFFLGTGFASWCDAKPTDAQSTLPVIIGPHDASPTVTAPLTNRIAGPALDGPTARFEERLEKGLKLRRPREKEFVARIAALVQHRILPRSLVDTSYNWARKRHQRFPFPYFQRAMVVRAAKMGVRLNAQGLIVP